MTGARTSGQVEHYIPMHVFKEYNHGTISTGKELWRSFGSVPWSKPVS